jgi:hypothetical protein
MSLLAVGAHFSAKNFSLAKACRAPLKMARHWYMVATSSGVGDFRYADEPARAGFRLGSGGAV